MPDNLVIVLNTASFELRPSTDGNWYVIHAQPDRPTIQATVGLPFQPGRNPWEWSSGYPARIQQALNRYTKEE